MRDVMFAAAIAAGGILVANAGSEVVTTGRQETVKSALDARTVGFRRAADGLERLTVNDRFVSLKPDADDWARADGLRDAAFYDTCDRKGTLVVQALPDDGEAAKKVVAAVRSHPSVICWEVESTSVPFARKLAKDDPSRVLVRPGDGRLSLDPPPRVVSATNVLWKNGGDGVAVYRVPAICTAPNGDLVAVADARKTWIHDLFSGEPIWTVVRRSSDGGRTWTKSEKTWDWPWNEKERFGASDPSLIVDREAGRIFLFVNVIEFVRGNGVYRFFVQESSDNGRSWTKPREISSDIAVEGWPFGKADIRGKQDANIFMTSGSGTQLRDGTLLHTITHARPGLVSLYGSTDHGKTWKAIGKPAPCGNESKVEELSDGAWMINGRRGNLREVAVSRDRGETWTVRRDPQLPDPACNAQLMRVGRHLLFSNCNSPFRRNLTVRASADDGRTWNDGVCISPDGTGYSDMTVLPNGDLGVLYEGVDYETIEFVTVPMEAVTGPDVSALEAKAADDMRNVIPKVAKWGREAMKFKYPPALGFHPAFRFTAGAYRMTVSAQGVTNVFYAAHCDEALTNVWDRLPEGWVTVRCEAVDRRTKEVLSLPVGERTFWKDAPFRPGCSPSARRSFRQAARLAYDYVFADDYVRGLEKAGEPSPAYRLSVYPAKMLSSVISAAVKGRRLDVARKAADYLMSISDPKDAPLAFLPPTYHFPTGYVGRGAAAAGNVHRNMMVYPFSAASAYLDLYEATGDAKYRQAVENILDTLLRLRDEYGDWRLVFDRGTGLPLEENTLVPSRAERLFARCARVLGDDRCRKVADGLWQKLRRGKLREWDWEGQFEDQEATLKYDNMTHVDVSTAMIPAVLERLGKTSEGLELARGLLRYCEDQFVCWEMPFYPQLKLMPRQWTWLDPGRAWLAPKPGNWWAFPCVLEQYNYYVPVDASAACLIKSYLALYRATGNLLDLEKAKALGVSLTRMQEDDGFIPTAWHGTEKMRRDGDALRSDYWINCLLEVAEVLDELAKETEPEIRKGSFTKWPCFGEGPLYLRLQSACACKVTVDDKLQGWMAGGPESRCFKLVGGKGDRTVRVITADPEAEVAFSFVESPGATRMADATFSEVPVRCDEGSRWLYRIPAGKKLVFRADGHFRGFPTAGVFCAKAGRMTVRWGDQQVEVVGKGTGGLGFDAVVPSETDSVEFAVEEGEFELIGVGFTSVSAPLAVADMQELCQRLCDKAVAEGLQGGVQFCAYRDGKKIVDVCAGRLSADGPAVRSDSLFPIFSTEKPLLSTACHRAVEKGLMAYDKPLCTWWPELRGDGKEKLTLRETLAYRTCLPGGRPGNLKTRDLCDWDLVCRTAAADKPYATPGTTQAYLPYAFAWMIGHPLEVAMKKPLKQVLDEEVLIPSGIEKDFFFVVPRKEYPRVAKFYYGSFCEVMNEDWARQALMPSAWAVSSADALCRFYNRLCGFDGKTPLIRKETLDAALKPCRHPSDPLPSPESMKRDWFMLFGMGYGLWGEAGRMDRVFGHGGAGGSEALVDRDQKLIVAFTCNYCKSCTPLRDSLYGVVGMHWRYWNDNVNIQDLQMSTSSGGNYGAGITSH